MSANTTDLCRVLVADDSPDVRLFLADRLRQAGYQTVEVADGIAALRCIQQSRADVALLDVALPGMNGLEVLKEARKLNQTITILLFTGLGGLSSAVEAVKNDADDFLTLPLHPDTLDFLVQKAMLNRQLKKENALCKELHGRLRHAQRLESIGKLTTGVAHDLNNLMTVVMSHSHSLLTRLDPEDPLQGTLTELQRMAERASSLSRQLLAFGRKQKAAPVRLDVNTVVRDMECMLGRLIGVGCELVTEFRPGPLWVKAGLGLIDQVLMNLVLNARDAMPRGGAITLSTNLQELPDGKRSRTQIIPPGRYICVSVADTGVGMDEATCDRLFEPFYTTKPAGQGTGLGLSIVWDIVQEVGGHVDVASMPNQGTTFTLYLPVAVAAGEPSPRHHKSNGVPPRGNETILLVEDEKGVRFVVSETLRRQGYTVLEAHDGREAMPLCENHAGPIHLLMTDIAMPRMGGEELAQRLHLLREDMRILFISGYTEANSLHNGHSNWHSSFLQKPFSPDALARKVREVLDA